MKNIARSDSAFSSAPLKGATELSEDPQVLIRPLAGRQAQKAIESFNREIVDSFGRDFDLYKDGMRAGLWSRTFGQVERVADNALGVVQDQHTLRDALVPTGAYRKNGLNPYKQRDWRAHVNEAHRSFSVNRGRFRSEHLEQGQSCVVKLPNGRVITMDESFLAFSTGAPVLVGTRFYKGPRGGVDACLTGSRCIDLKVDDVEVGRYFRLGADTAAVVDEDGRKTQYGPRSHFQVGPTASVVTCSTNSERLSIDNISILLADGEMTFAGLCEAKVARPEIFLGKQAGSMRAFVETQLHYALNALLQGSQVYDWFSSVVTARSGEAPANLQHVTSDAVTRVTDACARAGIAIEQLTLTPRWKGEFAQGVDHVSHEKIAATVKQVSEEARSRSHAFDKQQAARAVEIDAIEAQKITRKERLQLLQNLLEGRSFARTI